MSSSTRPEGREPSFEHPRFESLGLAGRGGMGAVFKAYDRELDETVAIKVLTLGEPTLIDRFRREVRIARNLQHPNICRTFDIYDLPTGERALAMAWIEGESLSAYLKRQPRPPIERVIEWGIGLSEALDYAHGQGVVHRDIKPSNILLGLDGAPIIVDFGIAREIGRGGELTQAGEMIGTPAYMAPEQLEQGPVDGRTDLFALGIILAQMLIGGFPGGVVKLSSAILARVVSPAEVDLAAAHPELPADLVELVRELTAPDPDQRPEDGRVVADRLRAMRTADVEPKPMAPTRPSSDPSRRLRAWVGASILALVAAVGFSVANRAGWWPGAPNAPRAPVPGEPVAATHEVGDAHSPPPPAEQPGDPDVAPAPQSANLPEPKPTKPARKRRSKPLLPGAEPM